jgi:DNA-binding NarL/FixJ family response regulator
MTHLAIIEDDALVRTNLATFFAEQEDITCDIVAESIEQFIELAGPVTKLDLILSDIGLPGINGIDAIPLLKKKFTAASVVMLSVYADSDRIFKALCAGAVGYLQKDTPLEEVLESLKVILKGGSVMSPAIARKVIEYFSPKRTYNEPLTAKERQVINAMVDGLSYKMIGGRLGISLETVRQHIKNIYRKLQVNSKVEVVARSIRGEL